MLSCKKDKWEYCEINLTVIQEEHQPPRTLLAANSAHLALQNIKMIQELPLNPDPILQDSVVGFLVIKVPGQVLMQGHCPGWETWGTCG